MSLYSSLYLIFIVFFILFVIKTMRSITRRVKQIKKSGGDSLHFRVKVNAIASLLIFVLSFISLLYLFFPTKSLIRRVVGNQKGPIVIVNLDSNWYAKYRVGIGSTIHQLNRLFELPAAFQVNFFENYQMQKVKSDPRLRTITVPDEKFKDIFRHAFFSALGSGTAYNKDQFVFTSNRYFSIQSNALGKISRFKEVINILEEVKSYSSGIPYIKPEVDVFIIFISPKPKQNFDTYLSGINSRKGYWDGVYDRSRGIHKHYANILVSPGWGVHGGAARTFDILIRKIENSKYAIDFPVYESYFGIKNNEKMIWIVILISLMILSFLASISLNKVKIVL